LIKEDASLEEVLEFLDSHPGGVSDEARATFSPSPAPKSSQPRRMLTLTELTDSPPFRVSAAPWTTVTTDDFFVSHLVSAYLSWYHWYYHNFDETLFLDAMASGKLDSAYCSPFLVNAILGMGCVSSCYPQALSNVH
jgi:branched-subunit amino acid aminotransferase/4-amino-4-deoxychorismate lyase